MGENARQGCIRECEVLNLFYYNWFRPAARRPAELASAAGKAHAAVLPLADREGTGHRPKAARVDLKEGLVLVSILLKLTFLYRCLLCVLVLTFCMHSTGLTPLAE